MSRDRRADTTDVDYGGTSSNGVMETSDLSDEMAAAARCAGTLERVGLRIAFRPGAPGERVGIELRRLSGELVMPLAPSELLDLVGMDAADLETWAAEVRP